MTILIQRYLLPAAVLLLLVLTVQTDAAPKTHVVRLTNIEFRPGKVAVAVGDTVTFINKDLFNHDVYIVHTANPNDIYHMASNLLPGASIKIAISEKALFSVYCTIHGGMRGKITSTGSFELTEEEKKLAAAKKVIPPIVKTGEALFWGKAQCHQCHQVGERGDGIRGPNLSDIGLRANVRANKLNLSSATEYLVQSILDPPAYIVESYTKDMATVYQEPIDLNAEEIKAIVTYLQSQSGEVDTWSIDIDEDKLATVPAMNPFEKGDATRGQVLFQDAGCPSCHTVGEKESVSPGPDLTAIGAYRNWTWLAESILNPNAEIGSNWHYATLHVKPPKKSFRSEVTVQGFVRENSDEEVNIEGSNRTVHAFPASRVISLDISEVSKMPTNYSEILTFQQVSDLIAFLQSLKEPKKGSVISAAQ